MRLLGLHAKTPAGYSPNVLGPTNALRLNTSPSSFSFYCIHTQGVKKAEQGAVLCCGKGKQVRGTRTQPLPCCVAWGNCISFSGPQSPHRPETRRLRMRCSPHCSLGSRITWEAFIKCKCSAPLQRFIFHETVWVKVSFKPSPSDSSVEPG